MRRHNYSDVSGHGQVASLLASLRYGLTTLYKYSYLFRLSPLASTICGCWYGIWTPSIVTVTLTSGHPTLVRIVTTPGSSVVMRKY
ncbi:hypothetical protein DPMN_142191 [Dreissena polymorpha]|uniref:Uncharacterized protein n=1 Tax=Dreissena polymorpha TaxID=45954 RepID=A0A9D4JKK8_DREPO|nr:hypothetical protein DPMN_142191 [Dreissena polymorpha]